MSDSRPELYRPITTAIASRPGMMQQSLRTSLAAVPWIEIVAALGDGLTALNYVAAHAPALLIIDSNLLDEESEALVAAIKTRQLPTRCVAFSRSTRCNVQVLALGADAVVARNGSQQELLAILARFRTEQPGVTRA
jgi:DNA-binding NarL/FixJ family response regulator